MQLKQNASTAFMRDKSATKLTESGGFIVQSMTNNAPAFVNPPVPVAVLKQTNDQYNTLAQAAKSGDHAIIAQRNAIAKTWKTQFKQTVDYVNQLAQGDVIIITKAGMTPTAAETTPTQRPDALQNAESTITGQPGGAEVKCKADAHVDAYLSIAMPEGTQWEVAEDGMITITMANGQPIYIKCDTHNDILMQGLTSHQPLSVLMQPVNTAGAGPVAQGMSVTPQ